MGEDHDKQGLSNALFLFFTAVYLFPIVRFLLIVAVAALVANNLFVNIIGRPNPHFLSETCIW